MNLLVEFQQRKFARLTMTLPAAQTDCYERTTTNRLLDTLTSQTECYESSTINRLLETLTSQTHRQPSATTIAPLRAYHCKSSATAGYNVETDPVLHIYYTLSPYPLAGYLSMRRIFGTRSPLMIKMIKRNF